jgi:hypothetical protein
VLAPAYADYHSEFRMRLIGLIIIAAGGWYLVIQRCARRGTTLLPGVKLGGVATMLLLVGTLQLPYRLIFDSRFPVYQWRQQECYATGERADALLLFCPHLTGGRNRIVPRSAPDLTPTERAAESIFTAFSPPAAAAAPRPR